MKKIVCSVEFVLADDKPNSIPMSEAAFEEMVTGCFLDDVAEEEVSAINVSITHAEGVTFMPE